MATSNSSEKEILRRHLAECGITHEEWRILLTVSRGPMQPVVVTGLCHSESTFSILGSISRTQCEAAQESCLARQYVRVMTRDSVRAITAELAKENVITIGPLPRDGTLAFTIKGARLFRRVASVFFPERLSRFVVVNTTRRPYAIYARRRQAAQRWVAVFQATGEVIFAGPPEKLDKWCFQWWEVHKGGVRVPIKLARGRKL